MPNRSNRPFNPFAATPSVDDNQLDISVKTWLVENLLGRLRYEVFGASPALASRDCFCAQAKKMAASVALWLNSKIGFSGITSLFAPHWTHRNAASSDLAN
jgi:hypothetical protein